MNPLTNLEQILAALGKEYRSMDAPVSLKVSLIEKTYRLRKERLPNYRWLWISGLSFTALVACIVAITSRYADRPGQPVLPSILNAQTTPSITMPQAPQPATSTSTQKAASQRVKAAITKHKQATDKTQPQDFLALPSSEGLPTPTAASLVRLRIRTASLQQYGLNASPPTAPETVLAEFVVGEDGLPRAIRIVR